MYTFPLLLAILLAYLGLHLGDRTEVPKELRAPLGYLDIYYSLSSFLESYEKMTDFDPIGEHDKPDKGASEKPAENIPLNPGGAMAGSTWEPEREQETSFGGTSLMTKVLRKHVEAWAKAQKHFI